MKPFETVYLDDPGEQGDEGGTFYDRPYNQGSGETRHPLGTYTITRRYVIHKNGEHRMLAVRLFFDSGERAIGKTPDRSPFKVVAYQFAGKSWNAR